MPPYNCQQAIEGLDQFSHIWIEFIFHQVDEDKTRLMVRPPRLGGNQRIGAFASRSPFRANRIGLSLVKLDKIEVKAGSYRIWFNGVDMVDQTPVIDIKPYIKYSDTALDAVSGYADEKPQPLYKVSFSSELLGRGVESSLRDELESILAYSILPAYRNEAEKGFAFRYRNFDIHARVAGDLVEVFDLKKQ